MSDNMPDELHMGRDSYHYIVQRSASTGVRYVRADLPEIVAALALIEASRKATPTQQGSDT